MTSGKSSENLICNIPLKLPGLNDYVRACRGNRYGSASLKRQTEADILPYLRKVRRIETPVRIRFTWVEKDRRRDLDNVAFAKKFILDAMVKSGVLKDDSQAWVTGFEDVLEHGKGYAVRIEVL